MYALHISIIHSVSNSERLMPLMHRYTHHILSRYAENILEHSHKSEVGLEHCETGQMLYKKCIYRYLPKCNRLIYAHTVYIRTLKY